MAGVFGAGGNEDADGTYDAFDPDTEPMPGPFLADHDVLAGPEHAAFHRLTRALFEERTVYDATFGYNLARLNLDARHPDAGYRYAREAADPAVLRAEFTPTTPFCPQARALVAGSFRAWNGLADRHEYDLVRVRVAPTHQASDAINDHLAALADHFRETGETTLEEGTAASSGQGDADASASGGGPRVPF